MDKKAAAKGIAWNMAFAVPAKILFPIVGIFIMRFVGPKDVGVYAVIATIFAVTELLREGGLGATYLADTKLDDKRRAHYATVSILSAIVFGVVLFLSRHLIAGFFERPVVAESLIWAAICVAAGGVATIPAVQLQRDVKFRELGTADFFATLASYTVAIVLAILGYGIVALIAQLVVRVSLYVLLVLRAGGFVRPSFAPESWKILRESASNLLANLAVFVYTTFDYILVAKWVGERANGAYYAAFNVASKPVDLLTSPVNRTIMVAYARAPGDVIRQADLWSRTVGGLALTTIPIYGLLGFFGPVIMETLYGKDFAHGGPVLSILAIYLGLRAFGSAAGSALVATGRPKIHTWAWVAGYAVAISCLFSIRLEPTLDKIVWCLTAGIAAVYVMLLIAAAKTMPPTAEQRTVLYRRIGGGLATAALIGLARLVPIVGWQQLLLACVVAAPVHLVLMSRILGGHPLSPAGIKQMLKNI